MQLQKILDRYPEANPDMLLEILIDVDEEKVDHFISEEEVGRIASHLSIKESHVCSVMSFYTLLSTSPRGKYIIQICKDVPCHLNDHFNVVDTVTDFLDVKVGGTTSDRLFTVEYTACIGCCDEAPAIRINHDTYTNLSKGKVITILEEYKGGKRI